MILNLLNLEIHVEELPRSNTLTTYDEILKYFGLPGFNRPKQWRDCPLYVLMGQIDRHDIAARRPLRTSSIVQRVNGKLTIPGSGYFKTLCRYRRVPMPKTEAEKIGLHNDELIALRAYYRVTAAVDPEDITECN